jgi:hypothetical protein
MTDYDHSGQERIDREPTTPHDARQTALTAFGHGRALTDGGVALSATEDFAATPPTYEQPYTEGDTPYSHYADAGKYGIMFAGEYQWDNIRCTAEAYGDTGCSRHGTPSRSLLFHTEWVDATTATECIREIGRYNRFDPAYVVTAIDEMPNTARFVVAREGSPALYVWTERPGDVTDVFEECGSDAYDRQQELSAELSAIQDERDTDDILILKSPEETSGRVRDILAELETGETTPAGAPDELRAVPNADTFPGTGGEGNDHAEPGTPTLIRAWWD